MGTYHLAPASFADSIPGAREALDAVEQVCGEVDMAEMQSMDGVQKVMAAMMLPDGKSLSDILTEEELGKLNAFMKGLLGADLDNPMINAQLGKMTPTAISTQLQLQFHHASGGGERQQQSNCVVRKRRCYRPEDTSHGRRCPQMGCLHLCDSCTWFTCDTPLVYRDCPQQRLNQNL